MTWGAEMAASGNDEFDDIARKLIGNKHKKAVLIYFDNEDAEGGDMRIATLNHGPFETADFLRVAAEAMANLKMGGAA